MSNYFSKPCNKVVELVLEAPEAIVIEQGGSQSGKTYGIMQAILVMMIENPGWKALCIAETHKQLERGCMTDLKDILSIDPHLKMYIKQFNKNEKKYYFHNGSLIEFASFETGFDAHAGKREISFFNEANCIPFSVFEQINMRTKIKTIVDFNPSSEFWIHTEVYKPVKKLNGIEVLDEEGKQIREIEYEKDPKTGDVVYHDYVVRDSFGNKVVENGKVKTVRKPLRKCVLHITTWRNNMYLSKQSIAKIERYKDTNPEYYKVYGLGEIGDMEDAVFKNVESCSSIPTSALLLFYGMDYSSGGEDPFCLVECRIDETENNLYVKELFYGRTNDMKLLANTIDLRCLPGNIIWADHNPLITHELGMLGCNIGKAHKPAGSLHAGILKLKGFNKIFITADSPNVLKDFKNYKYGKDKNDKNEPLPMKGFDHAPDAVRYALSKMDYVQKDVFVELNPKLWLR